MDVIHLVLLKHVMDCLHLLPQDALEFRLDLGREIELYIQFIHFATSPNQSCKTSQ